MERKIELIGDSITNAVLQKALDGVWQRQRAISNNIANYETPGYKAKKVSFESALAREVANIESSGNSNSGIAEIKSRIASMQFHETDLDNTSSRADGNNVDLDAESIDMAKTQLQYQYLTRSFSDGIARLRYAISEGRK
jgi:flagellar basal-body rod protein FlgB